MDVRAVMTIGIETIGPGDTVEYAATRMKAHEVGMLPVTEEGRAVGVLTDRDIALRGAAEGRHPGRTTVGDLMSREVVGCRETDDLPRAIALMEHKKVRRLVVTDEDGVVTGVLSVDDLAARLEDPGVFSRVLRASTPAAAPPARRP